jgi:heptaprenyl diphosphate synthase
MRLLGVSGLQENLDTVEERLRESVGAMDPFLAQVASHLVTAGGKRIRPALTMVSALAGGADVTEDVVMGGVAVELVHVGSLCHDDVMDEADSRRGVESVNHRWGNLVAILAGDFLLARASDICADLGTPMASLLARTIGRLCEGQVSELRTAFNVNRTEDEYLESLRGKTASLTSAACRIGALVAGLPDAQVDGLTQFGEAFGMCFQIRDDVLDIVGDEESLGKPVGQDLLEGTYSLPVLRALADPEVGAELRPLLGRALDAPERDKARAIVEESHGVEEALVVARAYADRSRAALSVFQGSPVADGMAGAAHRLLDSL